MMHSVDYAAAEGGWHVVVRHQMILSGATWVMLSHVGKGLVMDVKYSRWRHTSARVYRGRALSAILKGQKEIAAYLCST